MCLFLLRIVNSVEEDWVSQVQILKFALNVSWIVGQVFLERFFKGKANETAFSQIESEALTVLSWMLVPLQKYVAVGNGTLF